MTRTAIAVVLAAAALSAHADTTQLGPSIYKVDEGVDFTMGNAGNADYLFAWSDDSGTFTGLADVTLVLTAGQTYTFARTTGSHPFGICNDTLPVGGTDGSFFRTTFDSSIINGAILKPMDDFVANPAPTSDFISWTPTNDDVGIYYYTCLIAGHPDMTGKIEIVAADEPCLPDVNGDGMVSPTDFNAWINAFNNNLPECDQNLDGMCTPTDFNAWINNFNQGC